MGEAVARRAALALFLAGACGQTSESPVPSAGAGGAAIDAGGGGVAAACTALCDAVIAFGCEDSGCAGRCVDAYNAAGNCQDELGAYIGCLGDNASRIPSCFDHPAACEMTHDIYFACGSANGCGPVECPDVGSGTCSCQAFCNGSKVVETCSPSASGSGFDCTCEIDGSLKATCSELPGCAFFVGCCSTFL